MHVGDFLKPARFGHRIVVIVFDLKMDRFHDILILDVGEKIVDKIVLADRGIVTKHALEHRSLQPGVDAGLEIVKVMMRVDYRQIVHGGSRMRSGGIEAPLARCERQARSVPLKHQY
jgi:hypothetical protein